MFIDMPPGTGDVPLTVFQSLPVDAIIIVTSPQELVSMIVGKAVKMAAMMQIPILGLIENYSYFQCPDNGKKYHIFGPSHLQAAADAYGLKILAELPIDPDLAAACDSGNIENYQTNILDNVINILKNTNKIENWHQVLMPVFYHSRNSFINSKASASLISVNSPRISKNSLKYSAPTLLK